MKTQSAEFIEFSVMWACVCVCAHALACECTSKAFWELVLEKEISGLVPFFFFFIAIAWWLEIEY